MSDISNLILGKLAGMSPDEAKRFLDHLAEESRNPRPASPQEMSPGLDRPYSGSQGWE